MNDANTTLHVSCIEVYFDDVYDLLNKKVQIPIAGFGKSVKTKFAPPVTEK